jgi:hypothetical protein
VINDGVRAGSIKLHTELREASFSINVIRKTHTQLYSENL